MDSIAMDSGRILSLFIQIFLIAAFIAAILFIVQYRLIIHPLRTLNKNMDKSNNRYANLEALCIKCHSEQPGHSQLNNNPDLLRFEKLTKVYKEG